MSSQDEVAHQDSVADSTANATDSGVSSTAGSDSGELSDNQNVSDVIHQQDTQQYSPNQNRHDHGQQYSPDSPMPIHLQHKGSDMTPPGSPHTTHMFHTLSIADTTRLQSPQQSSSPNSASSTIATGSTIPTGSTVRSHLMPQSLSYGQPQQQQPQQQFHQDTTDALKAHLGQQSQQHHLGQHVQQSYSGVDQTQTEQLQRQAEYLRLQIQTQNLQTEQLQAQIRAQQHNLYNSPNVTNTTNSSGVPSVSAISGNTTSVPSVSNATGNIQSQFSRHQQLQVPQQSPYSPTLTHQFSIPHQQGITKTQQQVHSGQQVQYQQFQQPHPGQQSQQVHPGQQFQQPHPGQQSQQVHPGQQSQQVHPSQSSHLGPNQKHVDPYTLAIQHNIPQPYNLSTAPTNTSRQQDVSQWTSTADGGSTVGTKSSPHHINEFMNLIPRMYASVATGGSLGSSHFAVRIVREGEQYSENLMTNRNNTLAPPMCYVDVTANIESSRSLSQTLGKQGYYELHCTPEGVDGAMIAQLSERLEFLKGHIGSGTIRLPVYLGKEGDLRFSPRLFEFYSGNNKGKETMEIYAASNIDNASGMRKISVDSDEYKKHSGKIRVVGHFNNITVANGYIKLVFTARMLILAVTNTQTIGGISSTRQSAPAGTNSDDWQDLIDTFRGLVNSGIPVHMIKGSMMESLDNKLRVARNDSTYQTMMSQQVHPGQPSQQIHPGQPSQQVHPGQPSQQVHPGQPSHLGHMYGQQVHPGQSPQQVHPNQPSHLGQFQPPHLGQFQPPSYPPVNVGKAVPQYTRK
jgi:hypothetical protein